MLDVQTLPSLDRAFLARFTFGNTALEHEVLGLFAAQAPGTLQRLHEAGSETEWKEAAHTLKGSAAAVGAQRVAKLAEHAERLQRPEHPDLRAAVLADLSRALTETCQTIMSLPQD